MKRLLSLIVSATALGLVLTALALEAGGVATVTTETPAGAKRQTHIWFVNHEGQLYLEAGNPDSPWLNDLHGGQMLTLEGHGLDGSYRFVLHTSARDHERIRELMRAKYGWRDAWVSLVFDTSQSQMLKLTKLEKT